MSRIGSSPIKIPANVKVNVEQGVVTVEGPKGKLTQHIAADIEFALEDGQFTLTRKSDSKPDKAKHGLYRSLIANMVTGVTEGYKHTLELVGVGFKAEARSKQLLEMSLGYSHSVYFQLPDGVSAATETLKGKSPTITLESIDKQLLGQISAKLKSLRKVEPYKGKGIRFKGEQIRRKAGKTGGKK